MISGLLQKPLSPSAQQAPPSAFVGDAPQAPSRNQVAPTPVYADDVMPPAPAPPPQSPPSATQPHSPPAKAAPRQNNAPAAPEEQEQEEVEEKPKPQSRPSFWRRRAGMPAKEDDSTPKKSRLFDPRSKFFRNWDGLTAMLLVFTAIVTPYEVAFLISRFNALFGINRLVDMCFVVDMFFNFFLPYQDEEGTWVNNHRKVILKYVKGWFLIDIISILPFDLLGLLMNSDATSQLKVLRIIRLFRLAKLLRVLRAGRMFQRWESRLAINYSTIALVKFIITTIAIAHWLACAFHAFMSFEEDPTGNWLDNYAFVGGTSSIRSKYFASLYWAVATLSTLGYGDVVPTTDGERIFCIICTMLGASVYAYMVGAVCGIISAMDAKSTEYYQSMDNLNSFMEDRRFPQDLRERLRDYFRFKRGTQGVADWQAVISQMSPALQGEVANYIYAEQISTVSFFRGCPPRFTPQLAMALRTESYPAGETIVRPGEPADQMYIVEKGLVAAKGRIYSGGSVFGQDMVYENSRRTYTANSLTNTILLTISRDELFVVLENFPSVKRKLRREVVKMLFKEIVINYATAIKACMNKTGFEISGMFDQDLLPLIWEHRLKMFERQRPEHFQELVWAVMLVQRLWRGCVGRKEANRLREQQRRATPEVMLLIGALEHLRLSQLTEPLLDLGFDATTITLMTPDGMSHLMEVPVSTCIKVLGHFKKLEAGNASPSGRLPRNSSPFQRDLQPLPLPMPPPPPPPPQQQQFQPPPQLPTPEPGRAFAAGQAAGQAAVEGAAMAALEKERSALEQERLLLQHERAAGKEQLAVLTSAAQRIEATMTSLQGEIHRDVRAALDHFRSTAAGVASTGAGVGLGGAGAARAEAPAGTPAAADARAGAPDVLTPRSRYMLRSNPLSQEESASLQQLESKLDEILPSMHDALAEFERRSVESGRAEASGREAALRQQLSAISSSVAALQRQAQVQSPTPGADPNADLINMAVSGLTSKLDVVVMTTHHMRGLMQDMLSMQRAETEELLRLNSADAAAAVGEPEKRTLFANSAKYTPI